MRITVKTQIFLERKLSKRIREMGHAVNVDVSKDGWVSLSFEGGFSFIQLPKLKNHNTTRGMDESTEWVITNHPEMFI